MQKKLLLISMVVSCGMLQAGESSQDNITSEIHADQDQDAQFKEKLKAFLENSFSKNEDIISSYKNNLPEKYQKALTKELLGEKNAIEDQFKDNETANKNDEDDKRKYFDNSKPGYWATPATEESVKGYIEAEFAKLTVEKNKINEEIKQTFNGYKKVYNEAMTSVLQEEVVHANYEMEKTFFRALERCGDDKECLLDYNVHWPVEEDDLNRLIFVAVKSVIKIVRENNIPLTDDVVEVIARKEVFEKGERLLSLESAEESKKKVLAKLNDILNQKKKDEQSLLFGKDVTEDQNDQGALSQ